MISIVFLLFISPLLWMIVSSFKPEQQIFKDMQSLKAFIVNNPTIENYKNAFSRVTIFRYIGNSIFYVSLITIFGLIVNSLCGYALAKLKVPGSKYIVTLIISLIIIPFESIILPLYLIINDFGWTNKLIALVVPFIANCFNIYLFRQFFLGIPDELEEAASIDGASVLQIFIKIVLPLSKTMFATIFILTFVTQWGDFMWPLIVASDDSIRNIQVGLQFFFTDPPIRYGDILAALTFSTVPLGVIFLAFQKYYVEGISSSGIKG
ncbi:carbohydrate ABC transporter permease [Clostridium polyendosporum]|uniref:carbohydrate ABC transporter permease n=1 Tax=Clostridium polyendosporum TaxID=69208 RepID=UPI001FE395ED|nr:carbohydrate ABC transporter permease [Clostridium polyendosporum]